MTRFLFGTGTARGGTGLATRMLSVSPHVEIALDPYLAIYKELRHSLVNACDDEPLKQSFDPASPLASYYFSSAERKVLDLVLGGDLNTEFPRGRRTSMLETLKKRALLSSGDLVRVMDQLQGTTYKELFSSAAHLIATSRRKPAAWLGIHENWTIEFFLPLAKAFPEAKFLIVLRDPRAVIASNQKVADVALKGQILSYAKSLRKLHALAWYFGTLPLFQNRLHVVRFEDLVTDPETHCRAMCTFLETPYLADMLDTSKYVEPADGSVYNGFSSFENTAEGISTHRIHRWKKHLPPAEIEMVDFLCGPEMALWGYSTESQPLGSPLTNAATDAFLKDLQGTKNWRCDFGDAKQDLGFELFRQSLLHLASAQTSRVSATEGYLFPEVLDRLRSLVHKTPQTRLVGERA